MERIAERGIAAHWQYKDTDREVAAPEARAREWLTSISEMQSATNSEEFMEHVKVNLFPDAVYIFTPKGDILRLPRGSTCVDFAYAVHTDVGNRCVAAKIDRRLMPLRTPIENGQTVEIITAKSAHPNPSWVNFVATAKARSSIRQYLKNLRFGEALDLGKRLLDQALRDAGTPLRKISDQQMKSLLDEFGLNNTNELFGRSASASGSRPSWPRRCCSRRPRPPPSRASRHRLPLPAPKASWCPTRAAVIRFPGDDIMGYLSAGRGVVIHRNVCGNLGEYRKQPNKWIAVTWQAGIEREFSAEIRVDVDNRPGVLAEVAARIADCGLQYRAGVHRRGPGRVGHHAVLHPGAGSPAPGRM